MKGFNLTEKQLTELHVALRAERHKRYAYRIHAIILLGTGYTLKKVKKILFIDDETLRSYLANYRQNGIDGLLEDGRNGKACKLSSEQIELLCSELNTHIHQSTASIIKFIHHLFNVTYSVSGLRDLLHRLDYVYKKPKLVPGNPDLDAQEVFAKQYEDYMLSKGENTVVLFTDAVHPEHNSVAAYGWIKRGSDKALKTNSGRQRLNLHGAINAETHEITIIESDTINTDSTIRLLETIEQKYPSATSIKIILDNAKYYYSKAVQEYLKSSRIDFVFLPPYSPNLNLIERLWKFFKKKLLYNTYYKDIKAFRQACIKFFNTIDKYQDEIYQFMSAEFSIE